MKKYWSFFRMRFLGSLQYRAAAWAGIATQFAWGFMQLLMYRAFYEAGIPDGVFPAGNVYLAAAGIFDAVQYMAL